MGVMNRLRPKLAQVQGAAAFCRPLRTLRWARGGSRALYQYTMQDANLGELNEWTPKVLAKLRSIPILADVSTDLLTSAPQLSVNINRDRARALGVTPQMIDDTLNDALGQRQVVQYYTQLSHLQRRTGNLARASGGCPIALQNLRQVADDRADGPAVDAGERRHEEDGLPFVNHQSQFPAATVFFKPRPAFHRAGRTAIQAR